MDTCIFEKNKTPEIIQVLCPLHTARYLLSTPGRMSELQIPVYIVTPGQQEVIPIIPVHLDDDDDEHRLPSMDTFWPSRSHNS